MSDYVTVKIHTFKMIPLIGGRGPILTPIRITRSNYNELINLGFEVELVDEVKLEPIEPSVKEDATIIEKEEITELEIAINEDATEEEITESTEEELETVESTEEETVESDEEITLNDEELSANAYYEAAFLTRKKAVTILENREIEFNSKASAGDLVQMVLDTNPQVD